MIELRDYQEECVKRILASYHQDSSGTELVVLPTGAGKTIVFSAIIDQLQKAYELPAIVVAHRDELLDQAAEKYRIVKPDAVIGKIGSGQHQFGGELTVASIATISRPEHLKHLKALYGTGKGLVLVIDEAHHVAADGYQAVLEALQNAFKLFVTATPDRLDNKPILANKKPLYEASIIDMIQQGYLCDLKCVAVKTQTNLDNLHTQAGDFKPGELEEAIDNEARNNLIVQKYQEHTPGKRAVVFCVTIAHAHNLAAAFCSAGIPAETVTGDTPIDVRKQIYHRFRTGETLVMTNVMVLSEGWDEPKCEVGIGARPTQSRALYVQQLGRILRLAPGKAFATWLDITDNCMVHRLEPQSLSKILGKKMKPDELLTEAIEREEHEMAEQRAQVRKLKAVRKEDLFIDLTGKLVWQEKTDGMFVMVVGREQHRIALVPSETQDGYYSVWARLWPSFEPQCWTTDQNNMVVDQPLDWAQTLAEKNAKLLLSDRNAMRTLDKLAPWRQRIEPCTEKQIKMLNWKKIQYVGPLTKVEASELIDAYFVKKEQQETAKAFKKAMNRNETAAQKKTSLLLG